MRQLLLLLAMPVCLMACTAGEPGHDSSPDADIPPTASAPSERLAETIPQIYLRSCHSCHETGVTGAPRTGVVADWQPRAAKGLNMLVANAMNGYRAMPPKGLCFDCSRDEFAALVRYMADGALEQGPASPGNSAPR